MTIKRIIIVATISISLLHTRISLNAQNMNKEKTPQNSRYLN